MSSGLFGDETGDFYFKVVDCLKENRAKCIEVKGIILKNIVETIRPICELNLEFYELIDSPRILL